MLSILTQNNVLKHKAVSVYASFLPMSFQEESGLECVYSRKKHGKQATEMPASFAFSVSRASGNLVFSVYTETPGRTSGKRLALLSNLDKKCLLR